MRIEAIEADAAVQLSAQTSYIDQMGLNAWVRPSSLNDNSGTRKLRENGWRSQDLYEVVKNLSLTVQANKIMVLKLLKRAELMKLLWMLDKNQLLLGLKFFPKAKLLSLIMSLPKSVLVQMLLKIYPLHVLISQMPKEELFAILRSSKLDVRQLVKGLEKMDPKFLHFIMSKITGQNVGHLGVHEMMDVFMKMNKRTILNGMEMLPYKALMPFVFFFVNQDKSLLENTSRGFMAKSFDLAGKHGMIDAASILPESIIIRFLSQLQDSYLVQIASQLDPKMLEAYLISEQADLLVQLGGLGSLAA